MSALNLVPNPALIAAQAAVFLANIWVVKKYVIGPYLTLQEKRDIETSLLEKRAREDHKKLSEESTKLAEQLSNARHEAKKEKEKILLLGKNDHKKLLADAKSTALNLIDAARQDADIATYNPEKLAPICADLAQIAVRSLIA